MTRDEMIDSVIDILDETINEFETLSKSVQESSGGGGKLADGLSGEKAANLKLKNAGSELQEAVPSEKGELPVESASENPEGYTTRGYKEKGVNAPAFQKADEEEEGEEDDEKKKKKVKVKVEEKVEKSEKDESEELEKSEEKEELEKSEEKEQKEEVKDLSEELKKSEEKNEALVKSIEAMQEQIKTLAESVKELSESPAQPKGMMYNQFKPLKKSEETEMLSKSDVVNKLFELQKSGKDISTEDIVKAELGSDEAANAIARKYL